jgi:hypothetical protein
MRYPRCWRSSARRPSRSRQRSRSCPRSGTPTEHDWEARDAEQQRYRACFALDDEDADAARAFGCLLELPAPDGRQAHRYVTDAEWLADRLAQKIAAHAAAESERRERATERRATTAADDPEKEARRQERQRQYEERVAARARNLDLGAALARWEPKLDTAAVKLLGSLVLVEHGRSAAWAYRLCVEQPTATNKQGKVAVRYPRGAEAERQHHADALAALKRTQKVFGARAHGWATRRGRVPVRVPEPACGLPLDVDPLEPSAERSGRG